MAERNCMIGHLHLEFDTQVYSLEINLAVSLGFLGYMQASVANMQMDSLLIAPILDIDLIQLIKARVIQSYASSTIN